MRHLHIKAIESPRVKKEEINAVDSVDSVRILTVPEKKQNEWARAAKKQWRNWKLIVQAIVGKAVGNNKIARIIKQKIKRRAEKSKWRARKDKKWKWKSWRADKSDHE